MKNHFNNHDQRYQRRKKLAIIFLMLALPFLGFYLYTLQRMPAAMLTSENYMDRPLFSYWVNDHWGGNGGITCCWRFEGDTAKVVWVLDMTREQQQQGAKDERHEVVIPMPKQNKNDRYLHVRFDQGNKVRLGWSPDLFSPFSPRPETLERSE
ncbi:DUF3304 domain-containing protein [Pseudomonas chlororaphis]|uniref:DUF3304 domain-containing protein n=1 Tax=Pseudomonas chlororaphis TaxID=587753 RepID=UPI0009BA4832|nr:DUF3304 domain-containing protein [Pseudomonas chlororaphis]WDG80880.1 DUF3304 domain-containing protein [Pseudomonas chlororaphis]WDG86067.1 DUF3304 domain-containing protein [Pseudomonas chlororaphis]WDG92385.1 DUF3304 domain-containing protein [Pseudomonas chlororaphis]